MLLKIYRVAEAEFLGLSGTIPPAVTGDGVYEADVDACAEEEFEVRGFDQFVLEPSLAGWQQDCRIVHEVRRCLSIHFHNPPPMLTPSEVAPRQKRVLSFPAKRGYDNSLVDV